MWWVVLPPCLRVTWRASEIRRTPVLLGILLSAAGIGCGETRRQQLGPSPILVASPTLAPASIGTPNTLSAPADSTDPLPMSSISEAYESDVTVPHTKTEMFVPFVRRVALPIFQKFWLSMKPDLNGSTPIVEDETVEVKATMSSAGKMVSCEIIQRSVGIVMASDQRLQQACVDALPDPSPPPEARAKDGQIYFVFRSTLHSRPTPRGPAGWLEMKAELL